MVEKQSLTTSLSAVGGADSQRNPKVGILDQKSYTVSKLARRCYTTTENADLYRIPA